MSTTVKITNHYEEGFGPLRRQIFPMAVYTPLEGEHLFIAELRDGSTKPTYFMCASDQGVMNILPAQPVCPKAHMLELMNICTHMCPVLWMATQPNESQTMLASCGFTPVQTENPLWVSTPAVRKTTRGLQSINHTQQ